MVAILVANGFECAEALVTLDLLHRAEMNACLTALDGGEVVSANGVVVKADQVLTELGTEAFLAELDLLILAGGMENVTTLRNAPAVKEVVARMAEAGKPVAAICAAPPHSGGSGPVGRKKCGLLSRPGAGHGAARVQKGSKVVVDGRLITGQGPGAVFDFALKLIEVLKGEETMRKVKDEIHYQD